MHVENEVPLPDELRPGDVVYLIPDDEEMIPLPSRPGEMIYEVPSEVISDKLKRGKRCWRSSF
jgi:hypothetical protein